jgi:hypothetical protein
MRLLLQIVTKFLRKKEIMGNTLIRHKIFPIWADRGVKMVLWLKNGISRLTAFLAKTTGTYRR